MSGDARRVVKKGRLSQSNDALITDPDRIACQYAARSERLINWSGHPSAATWTRLHEAAMTAIGLAYLEAGGSSRLKKASKIRYYYL